VLGCAARVVASKERRGCDAGEGQLAGPASLGWRGIAVALQAMRSDSRRGGCPKIGRERALGDLRCDLKRRC
jgi:hypothetical protein